MLFALALSCASPDRQDAVTGLVRASMALRGTRPSLADLRAVADDPDAAAAILDGYVLDPAFGATVRDLHAADLLLRSEGNRLPAMGALADTPGLAISRSVVEEPLRTIEWVVTTGRPYTDFVATDVVLADATVATIWGLDRDEADPDAWVPTTWGDGRPAAGILVSSGLWYRHASNGENQNRARANRITRALVCQDFLLTDIPIDDAFADAREVGDAIRTEPACTACHDALDPIASAFYGFEDMPDNTSATAGCEALEAGEAGATCYPLVGWRPDRVDAWVDHAMPEPAWFGTPVADLVALGQAMVADPRFPTCAAGRFAAWLEHARRDDLDTADVDALADEFVASGYDARALARSVVDTPAFRDAPPMRARPEELSRMYADLTGWTWTDADGVDLLTSDREGWRTLAGGIDSSTVTVPDAAATPTRALVLARAAESAAAFVVAADLAEPDRARRRLLTRVDADTTDATAVRAQLADLHLRILGEDVPADGEEVGETWALFQGALARGGVSHAWEVTLAAMLQDGRVAWL